MLQGILSSFDSRHQKALMSGGQSIGILQHFFNFFPDSQGLRIRTADGLDFLTTISKREIVEYDLNSPSQVTLSLIYSERMTYVTGGKKSMLHAVWRFSKQGSSTANVSAMLDLASMQFGVNGKGKGGESFFLGSKDGFDLFLGTICENVVFKKSSLWIGKSPDDPWFQDVAKRVKQRWDERDTKPWCGQCGAPLREPKRCPCKGAYYCGSVHQQAAWRFHKHHCSTRRK